MYKSNDSGATRTTDGSDIVIPYFDFTVSDASNNRTEGRIFSQKWGFITYDPATFVPAIGFDFKGKFFGYTDDKIMRNTLYNNDTDSMIEDQVEMIADEVINRDLEEQSANHRIY